MVAAEIGATTGKAVLGDNVGGLRGCAGTARRLIAAIGVGVQLLVEERVGFLSSPKYRAEVGNAVGSLDVAESEAIVVNVADNGGGGRSGAVEGAFGV